MAQYLAANGLPFTDHDAAEHKAARMSSESGDVFQVVDVDGGYAVEADSTVAPPPAPAPTEREEPEEKSFVFSMRPAWRAQLAGFFLMSLGVLLVIAPTWPIAIISMDAMYELDGRLPGIWDDIQLGGFALVLIGIGVTLWRRYWQKSVITNNDVSQSVGVLFMNSVSQIDLANVHIVDVKRPNLAHMLLNLGTVELSTPGSSGADVAIVDVVAPKKCAAYIRERVARCKAHRELRATA